ncbi:MAG: hypothetical protein Q6L60_05390 [Thermostichus sp. HHBFW_bins_43]
MVLLLAKLIAALLFVLCLRWVIRQKFGGAGVLAGTSGVIDLQCRNWGSLIEQR